jgi:hypothetical protein
MEDFWLHSGKEVKASESHHHLLTEFVSLRSSDASKNVNASQSNERIISIDEVDKTIGTWQKKQYENLGVQRIHIGKGHVELDFAAAVKKNALVISLEFDKQFAFNFSKHGDAWTLNSVRGLKVEGQNISKAESSDGKITFYTTDNRKLEYGKAVNSYTRALFDPLMSDNLRR